jgi:hypothetical protein
MSRSDRPPRPAKRLHLIGLGDTTAADRAKAERASAPIVFPSNGKHLSFGGISRWRTHPDSAGLDERAAKEIHLENLPDTSWVGGEKLIRARAQEAQVRARTRLERFKAIMRGKYV